jgi:hypothetical protein
MRIALVLLSLLLVVGCGDNGSDPKIEPKPVPTGVVPSASASGTPGSEFLPDIPKESADALPACSEVWVVGDTLPEDYEGCRTKGGVDQGARYACTDGGGELIGHNDQFFARLGGVIKAYGEDDIDFSHELFEVCKPKQ